MTHFLQQLGKVWHLSTHNLHEWKQTHIRELCFSVVFFKDSTTCYWAKAIELDKKYLRLQKSSSDKVEKRLTYSTCSVTRTQSTWTF